MKPALTAEEWSRNRFMPEGENLVIDRAIVDGRVVTGDRAFGIDLQHSGEGAFPRPKTLHALAALALDGQPFGFMREHAIGLGGAIERLRGDPSVGARMTVALLEETKEIIEALLPPPPSIATVEASKISVLDHRII